MIIHTKDGVIFKTADEESVRLEAQRLYHDVYLEMGYINQPYPGRIIPFKYDKISTYIVGIQKHKVVGVIRFTPGPPFSAIQAVEGNLSSKARSLLKVVYEQPSAELGALAVKKEFRRTRVSWGLYKASWLMALLKQIDWYIICVDLLALRKIKQLGWYVQEIAPPVDYMGSPSVLGIIPVRKQLSAVYVKNFHYYKYLIQ